MSGKKVIIMTCVGLFCALPCSIGNQPAVAAGAGGKKAFAGADSWQKLMDSGNRALRLKKYDQAAASYGAALKETARFAADDTRIFDTLNGQLSVFYAQHKLTEAEPVFKKLTEFTAKVKGFDHADTVESLKNYAQLLKQIGKSHQCDVVENRVSSLSRGADGQHSHIANLIGPEITDNDAMFILADRQPDTWQIDADGSSITDATLARLGKFTKLERVDLSGTKVTDSGLSALKGKSTIRLLNLAGTGISDKGLDSLASMSGLSCLVLTGTKVTGAKLSVLHGLTALRKLSLDNVKLLPAGFAQLGKLTDLKELQLSGSNVTDLDLGSLTSMTGLCSLNLYDTHITDKGLLQLEKMKSLDSLNLNKTAATVQGVKSLRKALPECTVGFDK